MNIKKQLVTLLTLTLLIAGGADAATVKTIAPAKAKASVSALKLKPIYVNKFKVKNLKVGKPIAAAAVAPKITFLVTFPKKGSVLEAGNPYTLTWRSDNTDKTSYPVLLVNNSTKKEISLGKAYEKGNVFSFVLSKDVPEGKYKIVFDGKQGGESNVFDVVVKPTLVSTKLESFPGDAVPNNTAVNVAYRVTSMRDPVAPVFKIVCPANVSAKYINIERCNTTIPLSLFGESTAGNALYYLNLPFTNVGVTSELVTMEGFIGTKSIGKVINRIDPTKAVSAYKFSSVASTMPTNVFVDYTLAIDLTKVEPVNTNVRVLCPAGVTAKIIGDVADKCGKIVPTSAFSAPAGGASKTVSQQFQFSNSGKTSLTVTAEAVVNNGVNGQSGTVVGSVSDTIAPTIPGPVITIKTPILTKVSSTVTTITNNNFDVAVTASARMTIQPVGADINARTITAVVGLKNFATGEVLAKRSISGTTESGLAYFADGATKPLEFTATFATSSLPFGTTNIKGFVESITYKSNSITAATSTITAGLDRFDSDAYTTYTGAGSLKFTRDLTLGSWGDDVVLLKQYLTVNGFMSASSTASASNYFGPETKDALAKFQVSRGIYPAEGYFGPIARAVFNTLIK